MKRSIVYKSFGFLLLAGLILNLAGVQTVQAQTVSQADLTLADLGLKVPQILTGPISELELTFNLPPDWKPEGTASLDLDIMAYFSSLMVTESSDTLTGLVGGDLSLYLNDTMIGVNTLQASGAQTLHFEINAALFAPVTRDGVNLLRIRWDGSISCLQNLLSSITISPSSKLTFGYDAEQKTLSLNDFPAPFVVKNSILPVPLKIVLPANPSAGELRASIILAAGIGQISNGQTLAEVITQDDYHPLETESQNVILVANSDTLKTLSLATLGLAASDLQANAGEGLVHFFRPAGGYGLLVSGDETGIVKAAQAVSADQVIAGGEADTMLVSGINPAAATTGLEDLTLDDLGVGELVFTKPNNLSQSFEFFVPAGNQVRADASFDLVLSHSQQLDYLRSGLQMLVNGYPAVSLRLTDNTSNQAVFKLIMPANLVHAGRNTVEFVADLNTRDLCTAATKNVAWLRISSSSLMHLPLEAALGGSMVAKTFADFPNAFLTGSGLDNVLIEVAPGKFGNIQAAAQLAGQLGAGMPDHSIMQLNAVFADSLDPAMVDASLILVGTPSDFTSLTEKIQFPSLMFDAQNLLSDQSALELVTRPQADSDSGYLAIRGYDVATSKVLLAVLGSNPAGLTYAVDALTSEQAAANNFLIVTGKNEQTGWLDKGIATGEIATPSSQQTEVTPGTDSVQVFRISMLKWVVPALVVLLAIMLLFLYIEIRQSLRKKN